MNDVSDISQILDQVDRRLGEIRQQIVRIAGDAEPFEASDAPPPVSEPETIEPETPPEVDVEPESPPEADVEPEALDSEMEAEPFAEPGIEPMEPEPPAADAEPSPPLEPMPSPPLEPMPPPPEPPLPPQPPERPGPPEPPAPPPPPAPLARESEAQPSPEIEQLLSLRQRLIGDARELIHTYEEEIAALESRFGIASPPQLFEGVVTLVVTGVARIQTLVAIEEALLGIEGVLEAFVRHYDRGEGWFDISLERPVAMIVELTESLPVPFEIRSATANELVLDLDAGTASL